ncbi:MAG: ATP synthase subunit I [Candidatus Binatia bacterium]
MTSTVLPLICALLAGIGLGLFYFGGLWLTVQRLPMIRHPALLMLGSFFMRTLVALLGFYVVMSGSWARLLVCFAGFLAIRTLLASRSALMFMTSS